MSILGSSARQPAAPALPEALDPMTLRDDSAVLTYDVARDGGAVGSHGLTGRWLPPGAILTSVVVRIDERFEHAPLPPASRRHPASLLPSLNVCLADRALTPPWPLSTGRTWTAGAVYRLALSTTGRAVVVLPDTSLSVHVDPVESVGFIAGRLTIAVTYVRLPGVFA